MIEPSEIAARRAAFRKLHERGCFVIPNPSDAGSASILSQLGFSALATSSAALAFSRGLPDTPEALSRDVVLRHVSEIVAATRLPVNADFQAGYADDAAGVAESVRLCLDTGVAGLSIEDASGDPGEPLYPLSTAVERIKAARRAIDESGTGAVLTGRAECFLTGHPQPLEESIRRLQAYAEAGAEVLFAPGIRDRDSIRALVSAVAPKPVNLLIGWRTQLHLAELADLGVRRVSVGSALARCAWTAFCAAAKALSDGGDFSRFEGIMSTGELSDWFKA